MHVVALKDEAIAAHPELPTALFELFAAADMVAETYSSTPLRRALPGPNIPLRKK